MRPNSPTHKTSVAVQQPALGQVRQQGGDRLIGFARIAAMVAGAVAVTVPVVGIQLDEPHAPLDHSPGQQAHPSKPGRRFAVGAIQSVRRGGFLVQVDQFRRRGLHAKGQLVIRDPRGQVRVVSPRGLVRSIPDADLVEQHPLIARRDLRRRREVLNRGPLGAHQRALIHGRQETRAVGTAGAADHAVGHYHERRQVVTLAIPGPIRPNCRRWDGPIASFPSAPATTLARE